MRRRRWQCVRALPTGLNAWLSMLPTVQFQALVSAVLAGGTACVYWVCLVAQIPIDSMNFGIWLSFVAAYGGVTYYKTFKSKRETFRPEVRSRQNRDVAHHDNATPSST